MAKLTIFDASLQEEVLHTVEVDQNNEVVATSDVSGRVIKFPGGLNADELKAAIADHKANNEGQEVISQEVLDAQEEERAKAVEALDALDENKE